MSQKCDGEEQNGLCSVHLLPFLFVCACLKDKEMSQVEEVWGPSPTLALTCWTGLRTNSSACVLLPPSSQPLEIPLCFQNGCQVIVFFFKLHSFKQCLWCITTKSCITYPVRTILPPHAVCPLTDARWGLCWSKTHPCNTSILQFVQILQFKNNHLQILNIYKHWRASKILGNGWNGLVAWQVSVALRFNRTSSCCCCNTGRLCLHLHVCWSCSNAIGDKSCSWSLF